MVKNLYNSLPQELLNIQVRNSDEDYISIKELIALEVDEDIVHSTYTLDVNYANEPMIRGLTLWSEDHVYILIYSQIGYFFAKEERNPDECS